MKLCRVTVSPEPLSSFQKQQIARGKRLVWEVVDKNWDRLFESENLDKAIDFANENLNASWISKYTKI